MVEGTEGSHHKEGSTKMSKDTTLCAGIDTGKHKLDVAIDGGAERVQVDNNSEGHRSLLAWLRQREVERIGIEASGGYEQAVVSSLRAEDVTWTQDETDELLAPYGEWAGLASLYLLHAYKNGLVPVPKPRAA